MSFGVPEINTVSVPAKDLAWFDSAEPKSNEPTYV
jgi:hypothetical protein